MTRDDKKYSEIRFLVLRCLDGNNTEEEVRKLESLLTGNPDAQEYYLKFLKVSLGLRQAKELGNIVFHQQPDGEGGIDVDLWKALAESEKMAAPLEIEKPKQGLDFDKGYVSKANVDKPSRKISKPLLITAITSMAALIFIMLFVCTHPKPVYRPVATLMDSIGAQWGESVFSMEKGSTMYSSEESTWLLKGLAKISFDYGAEVIVEGPAEFELKTADEILLHSGRLFANVPASAIGFTVDTPNSSIVDLGTEFGVKVDFEGETDLHMFKGKASLIAGGKGKTSDSQIVSIGQAMRVNSAGQVRDIPVQGKAFVRRIVSDKGYVWRGQDFNLADVVGKGNGFGTGDYKISLDPSKGIFVRVIPEWIFINESTGYIPVPESTFIDGVFIPDGETGDVKISSLGHYFKGCPDTSNHDRTYGFIRTGGQVLTFQTTNDYRNFVLDNRRYGGKDNPVIFLHTNVGITFDLNAVRASLPEGVNIKRFTSLCGVSDNAPRDDLGKSDFRVLVDGEKRFEFLNMTKKDPAQSVDIAIKPEDRFLTLVTTDAGDESYNDYCLFARPVLELD